MYFLRQKVFTNAKEDCTQEMNSFENRQWKIEQGYLNIPLSILHYLFLFFTWKGPIQLSHNRLLSF